ncbi:MAG: tetratricopeptide repeat protein [Planctomycetes bacterium]|nr:tetratricopeptide repeat protein [Planctomycetota bacterium]
MKQTLIGFLSTALWLAAGPLWAQTSGKEDPLSALQDQSRDSVTKQSREMMQEHIAVFRVLLHRSLEKTYGFPLQVPGHHHGMGGGGGFAGMGGGGGFAGAGGGGGKGGRDAFHQLPAVEGIYLGGYGIVYSLSAPPAHDPLAKETPAEIKEVSPWQRASQELRGEKVTQETSASAPRRVSLSESLLRLLAENGKHFSQLPADERITVAITFRRNMDCGNCHQNPWAGDTSTSRGRTLGEKTQRGTSSTSSLPAETLRAQELAGQQGASYAPSTEVKNEVLLADLHVKQGRYAEAVKVYREALVKLAGTLAPADKRTHGDVQKLLAAGEIANRLAQALLAQGQRDQARQLMDSSLKMTEAAVKLADSLKGRPVRSGISLPSQLIVSAPKKLLTQVGDGKMSFEEFRKAAAVEYVRFADAKDGKTEDKKP